MKSSLSSLAFFSVFFFAIAGAIFVEGVEANEIKFDRQRCIQSLEKEGLSQEKASIWCNFKQTCLKRSQQEGLPPEAAESVCNCSINEFRKKYTPQQFKTLIAQENTNPEVREKLRDVGEMCFEKILYED